jgi:hypothetical protein
MMLEEATMSVRNVAGTVLEGGAIIAAATGDTLLFWVCLPAALLVAAVILVAGSWAVQR